MKITATVLFTFLVLFSHGQKKKTYFPAWTFQQNNVTIYGLSVGLWNFYSDTRNTTTNGIRLSVIGEGLLVPLVPRSPIADDDSTFESWKKEPISEYINGISLSGSGIAGRYSVNGIALGYIGHMAYKTNGISYAGFMNFSQVHNGIQAAIFINQSYRMSGIQIGMFNSSKRTRGIQVGLWNINERRKMPLINWNFRA